MDQQLSLPTPPAALTCGLCGQTVMEREGGGAKVHFAKLTDIRPCPGSWPQPKRPK